MSRTLFIKTGITGILALLLLIPLAGVGSIVRERIALRDSVVANIQQSSVTPQRLVGPILVVPFEKVIVDVVLDTKTGISAQQSLRTEAGQLLFLPENLEVNSSAKTQKRYRDIYSALLYESDNVLTGTFAIPENFGIQNTAPETVTRLRVARDRPRCQAAFTHHGAICRPRPATTNSPSIYVCKAPRRLH